MPQIHNVGGKNVKSIHRNFKPTNLEFLIKEMFVISNRTNPRMKRWAQTPSANPEFIFQVPFFKGAKR